MERKFSVDHNSPFRTIICLEDDDESFLIICIQSVNNIDCQKNMGDTSQSTYYQKCLIQFCFISYFNFYVRKPDVFSRGTVRMFTIHQLFGSLHLGNTRVKKKKEKKEKNCRSVGEG